VEAVEYFSLPLPAPYIVSRFRVCFRKNLTSSSFRMFYEKCFRFWLLKKSNASELLPLPASFFKVLPLPQKFNHFRFPISD